MADIYRLKNKIYPKGRNLVGVYKGSKAAKYIVAYDSDGVSHVLLDRQQYHFMVTSPSTVPAVGGVTVYPVIDYFHKNGLGQALGDTTLSGTLSAYIGPNTSQSPRTYTYSVNHLDENGDVIDSGTWTLTQAGRDTTPISMTITGVPVASTGGYATVNVSYDEDWSLTSYPNWVTRVTIVDQYGDEETFSGTHCGNAILRFYAGISSSSRSGSIVVSDDFGTTATVTIRQDAYTPSIIFQVAPNWLTLPNYEEAGDNVTLYANTNWQVVSILFYGEEEEGEVPIWDGSRYLSVSPSSGMATPQSGITLSVMRTLESEWPDNIIVSISNGTDIIHMTVSEFEEP